MTHQAPPTIAAAHTTRAEPAFWTLERMDLFIRALQRTRNVAAAARAAGVSRRSAYRLRARLRGHPFEKAWDAAMAPRTTYRRVIADHAVSHIVPASHTESR